MKKVAFMLLMVVLAFAAKAEEPEAERGVTASVLLGFTHDHFRDGHKWALGVEVTPRVGYRFNDKLEAGVLFKYENVAEAANYYGLGAYGQYSFARFLDSRLRLFVDLQAYYSWGGRDGYDGYIDNNGYPGANDDKQPTEVGFVPGVAYRIPGSKVDIMLRYLFIGFNNNDRWYKELGGCVGRGDWILDAGLRRLEIGVAYTF